MKDKKKLEKWVTNILAYNVLISLVVNIALVFIMGEEAPDWTAWWCVASLFGTGIIVLAFFNKPD